MRLEFDQSQPTTEFNKETQNKAIEVWVVHFTLRAKYEIKSNFL